MNSIQMTMKWVHFFWVDVAWMLISIPDGSGPPSILLLMVWNFQTAHSPIVVSLWKVFACLCSYYILLSYCQLGKTSKKKLYKEWKRYYWGEGVRKIIEFSSFTNDEKHGRVGFQSNISLLHRTQLWLI